MILAAWLACATPPAPDTVGIVVAARDVPSGTHLAPEDLAVVQVRPELVQPGVFRDPAALVGRVASERLLADEPVRAERLADPALQRELERMVPPGMEVTVLDLDPAAVHVPVAGQERVDVVKAPGTVVASGLPVLRVDGERIAVVATPEQVADLTDLAHEARLTVVPSSVPDLR